MVSKFLFQTFRELAEKKKAGETIPIEKMNLITAFDDEERWNKDASTFTPSSRKTQADEKNDTKSIERCLDRSLFLLVKQDDNWVLPKMLNENGESLRDTADRALQTYFGDHFKAQVLGNAPFIHFTLKYSKRYQEETNVRGEKVFVFKAHFNEGHLDLSQYEDFQWLKREELLEKVHTVLKKPLSTIIYEDE